jgi:DNA repair exonuclease SbcCD nuclease subunit
MALKILCTGDLHLGSSPSKLPDKLESRELFSPRAVFNASVTLAKTLKADVFILTGDLVDKSNAFYEAHNALSQGVKALIDSGIEVIAVSGNHDYGVLPDLAQGLPGFHLLGTDGQWEEHIIYHNETAVLRVQGRSFISSHQSKNVLDNYAKPDADIPTVGVLHCDVDNLSGNYAPVALSELKLKSPTAWLLGHIHKPTLFQENPAILYPGSPQGLDPSEKGPHGPWLIEIEGVHSANAKQYPLAALRYEHIKVSMQQAISFTDARNLLIKKLETWKNENAQELAEVKTIICRLTLNGETKILREVEKLAQELEAESAPLLDLFYLEKVLIECRPAIDLNEIAKHNDPPGLLARELLILQSQEQADNYRTIIEKTREHLVETEREIAFSEQKKTSEMSDLEIGAILLQSGMSILAKLLEQKDQP